MNLFKINEKIIEVSVPFVRENILERVVDTFDVTVRSIIISMN